MGCANGRTVCDCGRDGDLLASYHVVSLSHCVRSLSSCLLFGSYSRASFSPLAWSGLNPRRRGPSYLRHVFPVPCVSYGVLAFRPCLIRRVRSDRRPCFPVLALAIAWACVIPSVRFLASPRRRRLSASRLPCVSSSLLGSYPVPPCLVSLRPAVPRPDRRSACFAHLGLVRSRVGLALVRSYSVLPFAPPCLS